MKVRAHNMSVSNRRLGLETLEGRRLTAADVTVLPAVSEVPEGFIDSPAPTYADPDSTPVAEFGELPEGFIDSPAPTYAEPTDPQDTMDDWGWWLTLEDLLGS